MAHGFLVACSLVCSGPLFTCGHLGAITTTNQRVHTRWLKQLPIGMWASYRNYEILRVFKNVFWAVGGVFCCFHFRGAQTPPLPRNYGCPETAGVRTPLVPRTRGSPNEDFLAEKISWPREILYPEFSAERISFPKALYQDNLFLERSSARISYIFAETSLWGESLPWEQGFAKFGQRIVGCHGATPCYSPLRYLPLPRLMKRELVLNEICFLSREKLYRRGKFCGVTPLYRGQFPHEPLVSSLVCLVPDTPTLVHIRHRIERGDRPPRHNHRLASVASYVAFAPSRHKQLRRVSKVRHVTEPSKCTEFYM